MKILTIQNLQGEEERYEVGKRIHQLSEVVSDIIIDQDKVIVVLGSLFKVFSGLSYVYEELHATDNPYQYKNRRK